jgi:hypothetical protein
MVHEVRLTHRDQKYKDSCPLNPLKKYNDFQRTFNIMARSAAVLTILAVTGVLANNGIPGNYFTDSKGLNAAVAGAP